MFAAGTGRLEADFIHRKDGTKFEGVFQAVEGDSLVFKTPGGDLVRIKSDLVARIEILYTGIEACYVLREAPDNRVCSGILHTLTPTRVILAQKDRREQKQVIPLGDVKLLEFSKKSEGQAILPLLRSGIRVFLNSTEGEVEGLVENVSAQLVTLRVPGGARRTFRENQIRGGTYRPPRVYAPPQPPLLPKAATPAGKVAASRTLAPARIDPYDRVWNAWAVLPGISHFRRGQYLWGTTYVFSFLALAGGGYAEYAAARRVNAEKNSSLTYLLFNDSSYADRFKRHQANQRIIGGVAGLLYIIQLFHAGFTRLDTQPRGFEIMEPNQVSAQPRAFLDFGRDERGMMHGTVGLRLVF